MKEFLKKTNTFILISLPIAIILFIPCFYIIPYQSGDIGRMGCIPFGAYDTIFHSIEFNYVQNIDNFDSLQNADIITIGDSFSQQDREGYQNYIGHSINRIVYNFRLKDAQPENTAYTLIKKRMIPNCKVLIIESVERKFIKSLGKEFQILDNILYKPIMTTIPQNATKKVVDKSNSLVITLQQLSKFYKTTLSLSKNYDLLQLNKDMFTSQNYSKSLYFCNSVIVSDGDLLFKNLSIQNFQQAHNNLDSLVHEAHKHGIQIIYMVAADKYDMYYDYIEDNPYPRNPSFDYFKDYDTTVFINTKKLLLPYLQQGVKDIYRVNDTHWSPIAAKIVGEHIASIINNYLDNKK